MSKDYWEKLQDPRWQKKRLEVFEKAEFRCEKCFNDSNTLNVHHKTYFKGHEPWEYHVNQLSLLCKSCHQEEHNSFDLYKYLGSFAPVYGPNSRTELAILLYGYLNLDFEKALEKIGEPTDKGYIALYEAGKCARAYEVKKLKELYAK